MCGCVYIDIKQLLDASTSYWDKAIELTVKLNYLLSSASAVNNHVPVDAASKTLIQRGRIPCSPLEQLHKEGQYII